MKKRKLIISDQATEDLSDIWVYIANDNSDAADRFIDYLYDKCLLITNEPEMGRKRDDVLVGLRSFPVKRYMIYYRIRNHCIEIIRILSGYRDIDTLF